MREKGTCSDKESLETFKKVGGGAASGLTEAFAAAALLPGDFLILADRFQAGDHGALGTQRRTTNGSFYCSWTPFLLLGTFGEERTGENSCCCFRLVPEGN